MDFCVEDKRHVPFPSTEHEKICCCFNCSICLQFAFDAMLTHCGHLYCYLCINEYLKSRSAYQTLPQCVVCNAELSEKNMTQLYGPGESLEADAVEAFLQPKAGLLGGTRRSIRAAKGYKKILHIFIYVIAVVVCVLLGYAIQGFMMYMDSFLRDIFPSVVGGELEINRSIDEHYKFWYLRAFCSALVAPLLTRMLPRKRAALFAGKLFCVGSMCFIFTGQDCWMFIGGQIIATFGCGLFFASVF